MGRMGMMPGQMGAGDGCQIGERGDGGELLPELPGGRHPAGVGHQPGPHTGHRVRLFAGMGDCQSAVPLDERPLVR